MLPSCQQLLPLLMAKYSAQNPYMLHNLVVAQQSLRAAISYTDYYFILYTSTKFKLIGQETAT